MMRLRLQMLAVSKVPKLIPNLFFHEKPLGLLVSHGFIVINFSKVILSKFSLGKDKKV